MSPPKPKYAIHAGFITSINDGDRHWISAEQLIKLYKLQKEEYIIWDLRYNGRRYEDYKHLGPREDGRYGRPR